VNFSQAFEGPVKATIAGQEVVFPRLTIADYIDWAAELTAQRRKVAIESIPAALPMAQRAQMVRSINVDEATLDDISPLVYTPAGALKVLTKSLAKAGLDPVLVNSLSATDAMRLAMEVSSLFEVRGETAEGKKGSDPTPPAAATESSPASAATG
jgi:hypothetical protein